MARSQRSKARDGQLAQQEQAETEMPSVRRDPPARPVDQLLPYNAVMNPKPGFHYVLVSKDGTEYSSPEYYEMLGWTPVLYKDGKNETRLRAGKWKNGQPIEVMGQLLYQMDDERWNELQQFGENGNSGLAALDQLAIQMRKSGGIDPVRGQGPIGAQQYTTDRNVDAPVPEAFT